MVVPANRVLCNPQQHNLKILLGIAAFDLLGGHHPGNQPADVVLIVANGY